MEHRGEVDGAVDDGGVHDLAGAGGPGVVQRGEAADDEVEGAARVVAEEVGGGDGRAAGLAGHAEGAGAGEVGEVVAGPVGEGAFLAPAGHPAVDEAGVAGVAVGGADAEPFGDAGAVALQEDVGAGGQVEDARGAFGGLQVEDDGALVAVGDVEGGVDAEAGSPGAVHADDVGAEVGEEHGGEGRGADAGEFHDADTGERALEGRRCGRCRCSWHGILGGEQALGHWWVQGRTRGAIPRAPCSPTRPGEPTPTSARKFAPPPRSRTSPRPRPPWRAP